MFSKGWITSNQPKREPLLSLGSSLPYHLFFLFYPPSSVYVLYPFRYSPLLLPFLPFFPSHLFLKLSFLSSYFHSAEFVSTFLAFPSISFSIRLSPAFTLCHLQLPRTAEHQTSECVRQVNQAGERTCVAACAHRHAPTTCSPARTLNPPPSSFL